MNTNADYIPDWYIPSGKEQNQQITINIITL